jgi:phospholipase/carboxylesterase
MLKESVLLPRSGGKAKKLVVLFHGYGANGRDLLDLAHNWSPFMPETEFLAPDGPDVCETYPFGYQWFGLKEFTTPYVYAGLAEARPFLSHYLLNALVKRNLTPADLAVVGFSQGGMVALDMMFAVPGLRGVICYSGGFYPPPEMAIPQPHPEVLLVHGDADTLVPYAFFQEARQQLHQLGIHPQTLTCAGLEHSINEEGLKTGGKFLATLLSQEQPMIQAKQH